MERCHLFTAVTSAEKHIHSPQASVFLVLEVGWGILAKPPTGHFGIVSAGTSSLLLSLRKQEKLNISRRLLEVQQSAQTDSS